MPGIGGDDSDGPNSSASERRRTSLKERTVSGGPDVSERDLKEQRKTCFRRSFAINIIQRFRTGGGDVGVEEVVGTLVAGGADDERGFFSTRVRHT